MFKFSKLFSGVLIGGAIGIAAVLFFAPNKRDEWFNEIQEKTQDVLVEFNRAAQEYKDEMEEELKQRRQGA
jgi:gas vesicle protein